VFQPTLSQRTRQGWGNRWEFRCRGIRRPSARAGFVHEKRQYNLPMQKKIFWIVFILLGLLADFLLPFWWAFFATIPIIIIAWWVAYRSDWF